MVTIIYQHHATINFDKSVVAQLCLYIYHSDHLRDISGVRNFCLEGKSVVFPPFDVTVWIERHQARRKYTGISIWQWNTEKWMVVDCISFHVYIQISLLSGTDRNNMFQQLIVGHPHSENRISTVMCEYTCDCYLHYYM